MAFDRLESFGAQRDDLRIGNAIAEYVNSNRVDDGPRAKADWYVGYSDKPRPEPEKTPAEVSAEIDRLLGPLVIPGRQMPAKKITVDLETKTAGWTKGLEGASKEASSWAKDIEGKVKGLSFGGGQNFNAAGFAKFGETLKTVAEGAEEVATALRTGKGYGEAFSEAINKVPIVGAFKQAGEAISELITGTKAARIEQEKWNEHAVKLSHIYNQIERNQKGYGKFGEEKASIDIDSSRDAAKEKLQDEIRESLKKTKEIKRHDAYVGWYSDAQEAEMKRLRETRTALGNQMADEDKKAEDAKMRLRRGNSQGQKEFLRKLEDETEEVEAQMREKALKRQGKAIESAIVGIRAQAKKRVDDLGESVDDFHVAGMLPQEAAARRAAVAKAIASIEKDSAQAIAELQAANQHKEEVQETGHREKMRQIAASANVERLKLEDERINAVNEKTGVAARSHLSDLAQIDEEFQKQAREAVNKYKEEHPENTAGWFSDKTVRGTLEALRAEAANKRALLGEKSKNEETKNAENALREQRRLWEEAGGAQVKYAAKLSEINEHFDKFHDKSLRAAERQKLDRDTYNELRKLNPDHEANVNLYGRSQSYAGIKTGTGQSATLQQLELMKKQAAKHANWDTYFRDIWESQRPKGSGTTTEITI